MNVHYETASHSVYRFYDDAGTLLYVGCTGNLFSRLAGHRSQSPWYARIARVECEHFGSRGEAQLAERRRIEELRPEFNVNHNESVNRYGDYASVRAKFGGVA